MYWFYFLNLFHHSQSQACSIHQFPTSGIRRMCGDVSLIFTHYSNNFNDYKAHVSCSRKTLFGLDGFNAADHIQRFFLLMLPSTFFFFTLGYSFANCVKTHAVKQLIRCAVGCWGCRSRSQQHRRMLLSNVPANWPSHEVLGYSRVLHWRTADICSESSEKSHWFICIGFHIYISSIIGFILVIFCACWDNRLDVHIHTTYNRHLYLKAMYGRSSAMTFYMVGEYQIGDLRPFLFTGSLQIIQGPRPSHLYFALHEIQIRLIRWQGIELDSVVS